MNGENADQIVLTRAIWNKVGVCDGGGARTLSFVMQLEARKMAMSLLTPEMNEEGAVPKMIDPMIREDDEDDERSSKGGAPE